MENHYSLIPQLHRVCGISLVAIFVPLGATVSHGASSCRYDAYGASLSVTAFGGEMTVEIVTGSDCPWSVTGLPDWLTVSGSSQGIGSAEVTVVPKDNHGGTRIGVFTVAGVSVPIRQFDSAACSAGTGCLIRPVPHVAFGGIWTTDLFAVSTAAHAGDLSVAFYDDNGSPVAAPLTGGLGRLNTLTDSVPALGRKDYQASDPGAPTQWGWALVTADSSVETQAIFRNESPAGTYHEAAVQTGAAYSHFLIPFDTTTFAPAGRPLDTTFAIVNLNPLGAANVVCSARDASGALLADTLTIPSLKPLGHYAGFLFSPLTTGKRGTLECNADTMVSAIALRFIGDAFSTLPVILPDP